MKKPVKSIICPNPRCSREHGLFWHVGAGKKKQLMYRCDRVERQGKAKYTKSAIVVHITANLVAPPDIVPADGLPEEITGPAAEKVSEKQQYQLCLMVRTER